MKVDELLFSENYTTEMGIESIVNKVKVNFTGNYETHMAQSLDIAQGDKLLKSPWGVLCNI